jgi:hypothetical protein
MLSETSTLEPLSWSIHGTGSFLVNVKAVAYKRLPMLSEKNYSKKHLSVMTKTQTGCG